MNVKPATQTLLGVLALFLAVFLAAPYGAEQSIEVEGYDVHYSVVPSTFIQPEVAEKHNIVRADNRAVITITVRHDADLTSLDSVAGYFKNLLSQEITLDFELIEDGDTQYYLASFLYTNEEPLTFHIHLHFSDTVREISFKQAVSQF